MATCLRCGPARRAERRSFRTAPRLQHGLTRKGGVTRLKRLTRRYRQGSDLSDAAGPGTTRPVALAATLNSVRSLGDDLKLAILGMTGRPRSARELDATAPDVPSGQDIGRCPACGIRTYNGRDDGSISGSNGNALSSRPLHCLAITVGGEPDGREADYGTHRVTDLPIFSAHPVYRSTDLPIFPFLEVIIICPHASCPSRQGAM